MAGGAGKLKGLMDAKIWLYENIKEASSCDRESLTMSWYKKEKNKRESNNSIVYW